MPGRRTQGCSLLWSVVVAFAVLAAVVQVSAVQTGHAALSGVVIDAATSQPIAGVAVAAHSNTPRVSRATITDSKGRFVLVGLPASEHYSLSATRAGYLAGPLLQRQLLTGARFRLGEDEWRSDLVLTMRPLGSVNGHVVNERGDAVVDVPVRVLVREFVAGVPRWIGGPSTRTDDRGNFRIPHLRAGTYLVHVPSAQSVVLPTTPVAHLAGLSAADPRALSESAARVPTLYRDDVRLVVGMFAVPPVAASGMFVYPQTFYPSVETVDAAGIITLEGGEHRYGVDVVLRPVPGVDVRGRVTGPSSVVGGLLVRLVMPGAEFAAGAEQATTVTEPDGTFRFVGVPSGSYTAVATTRTGELTTQWDQSQQTIPATPGRPFEQMNLVIMGDLMLKTSADLGRARHSGRVDIEVGSQPVEGVTLALDPGVLVEGRIVTDDGSPLPETVQIWLDPADGDPNHGRLVTTVTTGGGTVGTFAIHGVPRGRFNIRAAEVVSRVKTVIADRDHTVTPLDVDGGAPVTNVQMTLTAQRATLRGQLRDGVGAVPPSAAVIVFPADRRQWTHYGLSPRRLRSIPVAGREGFELTTLPAGEYLVIAVHPEEADRWRDPAFLEAATSLAAPVRLEWGTTMNVDLVLREVRER